MITVCNQGERTSSNTSAVNPEEVQESGWRSQSRQIAVATKAKKNGADTVNQQTLCRFIPFKRRARAAA